MKVLSVFIAGVMALNLSCKDDPLSKEEPLKCPVKVVVGSTSKIVGKWKLVIWQDSGMMGPASPKDYSCDNIIYNFQSGGVLTITSDAGKFEDNTSWNYEFDPKGKLTIGNSNHLFKLSAAVLTIDDRPLDGAMLKFMRIK